MKDELLAERLQEVKEGNVISTDQLREKLFGKTKKDYPYNMKCIVCKETVALILQPVIEVKKPWNAVCDTCWVNNKR